MKQLRIRFDRAVKKGYIEKQQPRWENGHLPAQDIIKCPYCKNKKMDTSNEYYEECHGMHLCEYDIVCRECKEKLGHFAYGDMEYDFIKYPYDGLLYRIKQFIRSKRDRSSKCGNIDPFFDDLPF